MVEGPIDSLFLPNAIAAIGSDLRTTLANLEDGILEGCKTVLVFDNEPRNEEILKLMSKAIEENYSICIWPENVEEKDINDMVLVGKKVFPIIERNTFSGLQAKLRFDRWKKI